MSIFLYGRVSHSSSAESGLSIQDQLEAGQNYIASVIPEVPMHSQSWGTNKRGVFLDQGVSAWSRNFARRPGGSLIANLVDRGDHVVCYTIDRLARNLRDFSNLTHAWDKKGVNVHYIHDEINTQTAFGKFQANIKAAAAQFYSDLISERTREALLIKKLNMSSPTKPRERRLWLPSQYTEEVESDHAPRGGRIFMYERVSTDQQYISGLSLQNQSQRNMEYAQRLASKTGASIERVYSDPAVSAFKIPFHERRAGQELMKEVREGDHIIVYKLDRAWRHPGDAISMCEGLAAKGIYIHMVTEGLRTDTPRGAEWIGVLASMAHMESKMRSHRVREAFSRARAEGRPVSGTMRRGFTAKKVDKKHRVTVDREQAVKIRAAQIMHEELGWSYTQIEDVFLAWKCEPKGKATLADKKRLNVKRYIEDAKKLPGQLGQGFWDSLYQDAKDLIERPLPKDLWKLPRWEWPYGILETA